MVTLNLVVVVKILCGFYVEIGRNISYKWIIILLPINSMQASRNVRYDRDGEFSELEVQSEFSVYCGKEDIDDIWTTVFRERRSDVKDR